MYAHERAKGAETPRLIERAIRTKPTIQYKCRKCPAKPGISLYSDAKDAQPHPNTIPALESLSLFCIAA